MCNNNVEIIAWLRGNYDLVIPYLRGFITLSKNMSGRSNFTSACIRIIW